MSLKMEMTTADIIENAWQAAYDHGVVGDASMKEKEIEVALDLLRGINEVRVYDPDELAQSFIDPDNLSQ